MESDEQERRLSAAVSRGRKDAFVELVRLHEKSARAVAFSVTRSAHAMEDVLQEAYLKAYRSFHTYDQSSSFGAWLCRIVRNAAIDEVRKRKNDDEFDPRVLEKRAPLTRQHDETTVLRLEVNDALDTLPEAQRTAVLMVDAEQFSYAEAAIILDVPMGTVATRVRAARQALREMLSPSTEEASS